jgi:hypothetical protein
MRTAIPAALIALLACSDNVVVDPVPQAAGAYQLTHYYGRPLPDTFAQQRSRDGSIVYPCWFVREFGELNIDPGRGLFNYSITNLETCSGARSGLSATSGFYRQVRDTLYFEVRAADGLVFPWKGVISGDVIRFLPGYDELRFQKRH